MDEEQLIEAVIRLRLAHGAEGPAQVLERLKNEGVTGLEQSQVKKACSKATKRTGTVPSAAAPSEPADGKGEAAPQSARKAKQEAAKVKAKMAELKSAENLMMDAQRKLRALKSGGDQSAAVKIDGTAEQFIQKITAKALSGTLEDGDEKFLSARVDADIAALEWVKLASAAGALSLSEDVVALGCELQLTRLKEAKEAKDMAAARKLYVDESRPDAAAYQGVDRSIARAAATVQTGDAMEEMD